LKSLIKNRKTMRKFTACFGAALLTWLRSSPSESDAQAIRDRQVIPVAVNLNQVLRLKVLNGGNIEFVFNTIDDYENGLSSYGTGANPTGSRNSLQSPANAATTNPIGVDNPVVAGNQMVGSGATVGGQSTNGASGPTRPFYRTDFSVASSTRWMLEFGAEEATFIGTDDENNTMNLNNVGFSLHSWGAHTFQTNTSLGGGTDELRSWATGDDNSGATTPVALYQFPGGMPLIKDNDQATAANAGDEDDNFFSIAWRCGTGESTMDTEVTNMLATAAAMSGTSLMDQGNIIPDRYVVNVLMELSPDF